MPRRIRPRRYGERGDEMGGKSLFVALAALVWLIAVAPGALAAPVAPMHAPVTKEALVLEVRADCRQVRAFCQGRFYGGPAYRACVLDRGCPLVARPAPALTYCQKMHRNCRNRWGGGVQYRRCMINRGC